MADGAISEAAGAGCWAEGARGGGCVVLGHGAQRLLLKQRALVTDVPVVGLRAVAIARVADTIA